MVNSGQGHTNTKADLLSISFPHATNHAQLLDSPDSEFILCSENNCISLPSDCGDPEGVLRKDLPDKYEDEGVAQLTPEDDDEDLTMSIPTMGGDDIVLLYSTTDLELLDGGTTSTLTTLSSPDGFSVITELDGLAIDHCLGVSGSDTARVSRMVFGTV